MPETKRTLPYEALLRTLYEDYYVADGTPLDHISSHWQEFSRRFTIQLSHSGIPGALSGHGFGDTQIRTIRYRLLSKLAIAGQLASLPNRTELLRLLSGARHMARRMALGLNQDAFRQVCSFALIRSQLATDGNQPSRVLMIGDGYGFLGALLKQAYPRLQVTFVDLGKTLLFQAFHCQCGFPDHQHSGVLDAGDRRATSDFVYCPAEHLDRLSGRFDVAVNIASMQEMKKESVDEYFAFMRRHEVALFYCANRERKVLVGGETRNFSEYPWSPADKHLVDELCPWHRWYLSYRGRASGPRIFGLRAPLVRAFDGSHRHRLTRLAPGGGIVGGEAVS